MNFLLKSAAIAIALLVLLNTDVSASVIVNWGEAGGDAGIVTGNANGTYGTTYAGTYVSPANGTNGYDTGAAGQTRDYYGAMDVTGGPFGANNAGGGDVIQMVHNFGGTGGSVASMIAWESPDFLAGDRALESLTMEFQTRGGTTTANWLIETSAGWYQSDQLLTDDDFTSISSDVGDLTWSSFNSFGVSGGAAPADTDNIVSVGVSFSSTLPSGNWTGARLQHFEVSAIAVPEPSSLAFLGMGTLGLIGFRRQTRALVAQTI